MTSPALYTAPAAPLPAPVAVYNDLPLDFMRSNGRIYHVITGKKTCPRGYSPMPAPACGWIWSIPVCSDFKIVKHDDGPNGWFREIAFQDDAGKQHCMRVNDAELCAQFITFRYLVFHGFWINALPPGKRLLVLLLNQMDVSQ